jgi:two-component system, sensor histidine kinase
MLSKFTGPLHQEVVSLFEASCGAGLRFELKLADDLPEAIKSDPTRLRQVLVNLMGNAKKFTNEGTIVVEGTLQRSDEERAFIKITVKDTGIGMTQGTLAKLFTDFTQADASITRQFEGTGLGLSISRRLVELMGGEINVESEFGKGSTFWFIVPYIEATSNVQARRSGQSAQASSFETRRSLKILVAEDNKINQMIIGKLLETFGHKYAIAENGVKAVKAHEEGGYDLILMDVRMPEMSGLDATKLIREMNKDKAEIPIIALTADVMADNKKSYFEAGMNEVATKPIDRNELIAAINSAMGEEIHTLDFSEATVTISAPIENQENTDTSAAVDSFLKDIGQSTDLN